MTKLALDINGGVLAVAPPAIFCRSSLHRNSLPSQLRKTNNLYSNVSLNSNNQNTTLLHLGLGNLWTVPRQGNQKQAKSITCSQSAKGKTLEVEMPQAIDSVGSLGISTGQPSPLGVSQVGNKINFSLFAKHATSVTLCLYLGSSKAESKSWEIALDPTKHKTGDRWHVCIENLPLIGVFYGYRVDGPQGWEEGHRFDKNLILLDPYAKLVEGRKVFGDANEKMSRFLGTYDFSFSPFDWGDGYRRPEIPEEELVIYEMNVRAFTADPSSGLEHSIRGSYLGVIEKIPHLLELGINAVELLPVFEFDELEFQRRPNPRGHMINTWGYSTMNFFSPMTRYAANGGGPLAASLEFKKMVKALHAAGIEVILDVVYNHTNEADDEHPYTTSFRGIDNKVYYMLDINSHVQLLNFSGCGNTLNCNHPVVMELILDSLRHWVTEYHVDGFRFDLASVLCRGPDGNPLNAPPVVKAIAKDSVLSKCKIIAEPWDCGGLYLVGRFPNWDRWAEWNGKYRDDVRRFIKGDAGMKGSFATRLAGSSDLYKVNARKPYHSINFVIAHDGFTLYDLVAYNSKHNQLNGEEGRDGCNDNHSWNCGFEGKTKDPGVNALRARQMKNFHLALMVSQKIMWKINKSIVKEFLPTEPVDFLIEPWWGVCLVNFTLEEFRKLTEDEMATIDKICKEEANLFVLFDPQIIRGLYRRGLVYFDVPVYPDDRFKVSKLEGFVSNREQSYEDPTEELLYAVFVVSSEHATVAELATTLQADLPHLQAAASFACRLGWAIKVIDPASVLQDSSIPGSPNGLINDDEDGNSLTGLSTENPLGEKNSDFLADGVSIDSTKTSSSSVRVAFIVDANITSYLMMGSVSPGLKSHAVTLYEAGKLGDASIAELCNDLLALEGTKFEGELQEFANHASSLRCVLECLQSGGLTTDTTDGDVSDLIDALSGKSVFVDGENPRKSTGNSNVGQEQQSNGSGSNNFHLNSFGSGISQMNSQPFEPNDPLPEFKKAVDRSSDHFSGQVTKVDFDAEKEENSLSSIDTSVNSKNCVKRKRKYRVDVLRCESLAGLAPPTLHRLFRRDYDIIVSMIPLPSSPSVILPGGASPVHFGPPSYSSMTPWMKLILYSVAGSGPVSVVLMKGQRIRLLPPPLSGCEKALLWAWDGSTVGGLGGRFDGTLVNGNILLHCLNSLLKISAVLVLPLLKVDLNESGKPITKDIPLPLINLDGSCTVVNNEIGLSTEEIAQLNSTLMILAKELQFWTIGYLRLIKIHRMEDYENHSAKNTKCEWVPLGIEFGIPLFSPELCRSICQRVIQSQLLQANSLSEHREAMQKLRKRLRDFCADYHVTGPIAKLVYAREHSTRDASPMLTTYASGRWDPFVEPPYPQTASHKQPKSFDRQRRRSEILSFDGDILRSFALTPVYQPGTRLVEEYATTVDVTSEARPENSDDSDSIDVILPGVNLLFDGYLLHPFDIGTCLQGRLPVSLIAEASTASAVLQTRTN